MAVAMETAGAWRSSELPVQKSKNSPRTAWGADAQKLMQLMMGQLHSPEPPVGTTVQGAVVRDDVAAPSSPASAHELSTLDLFGCNAVRSSQLTESSPAEFLELEPEEPLPSGWEKCLDLKSGKLYYVQKSSGVSTFNDPRKQRTSTTDTVELQTQLQSAPHEFLGSKRSETLRQENSLRASSSSSSDQSPRRLTRKHSSLDLFHKAQQTWNYSQLDDRHATSCEVEDVEEESNVELDLNLAAGGSSPRVNRQTVCTMEMIQNALRRTEKKQYSPGTSITVKRDITMQHKLRSDPIDCCVAVSPSTSSSSSTSSRSRRALDDSRQQSALKSSSSASTGVSEGDDSGALVMGACTRCLMYVMLKKVDPKCPRCESQVPVDFGGPPCKRQRVGSERWE